MSKVEAQNGKCPDGYRFVYGKLCVSETTMEKTGLDEITVPEVPEFTDFACESAVSLLNGASQALAAALEVPYQLIRMAEKLLDYPADLAKEAIDGALNALGGINDAIDDLMSGPEGLLDALEAALDCPYIADSPLGKSLGGMIDNINDGKDLAQDQVDTLKNSVGSAANEVIDGVMEGPTGMLSKISDQYDALIKALGIEDLFNTLADLEECVENLCALYRTSEDFVKRLPKSSDEVAKSINGTYDREKRRLTTTVVEAKNATQQTAKDASNELSSLKNSFKVAS